MKHLNLVLVCGCVKYDMENDRLLKKRVVVATGNRWFPLWMQAMGRKSKISLSLSLASWYYELCLMFNVLDIWKEIPFCFFLEK